MTVEEVTIESVLEDRSAFQGNGGRALGDDMLATIHDMCSASRLEHGTLETLETGCGRSTLVFLAAQSDHHVAIEQSRLVRMKLAAHIEKLNITPDRVELLAGFAEEVLPGLALGREPHLDFALLDGGHGWPTVFVQLCYVNMMLKPGGHLAIDDLQVYSVGQMYLFLKHQPGWEEVERVRRTAVFRKDVTYSVFPNFTETPYITMLTT